MALSDCYLTLDRVIRVINVSLALHSEEETVRKYPFGLRQEEYLSSRKVNVGLEGCGVVGTMSTTKTENARRHAQKDTGSTDGWTKPTVSWKGISRVTAIAAEIVL